MTKDRKTIGIRIRFFTNNLPDRIGKDNNRIPFWTSGNVHLESNPMKGVKSKDELFHFIDDIPRAIRKVMSKGGLVALEDLAYSTRAKQRIQKSA